MYKNIEILYEIEYVDDQVSTYHDQRIFIIDFLKLK